MSKEYVIDTRYDIVDDEISIRVYRTNPDGSRSGCMIVFHDSELKLTYKGSQYVTYEVDRSHNEHSRFKILDIPNNVEEENNLADEIDRTG